MEGSPLFFCLFLRKGLSIMVENGVYIIKEEYFKKFKNMGSKFKDNKSGKRPTFCCVQDKYEKELFWAIPASKITEDKNMKRIEEYVNSKTSNIKSSFYHIGMTNRPCIFCISSCFPIIDKYIEREYIVNGKHLIINNEKQNKILRTKLKRILQAENLNPNKFEQHITNIKNELIKEIEISNN